MTCLKQETVYSSYFKKNLGPLIYFDEGMI